jgi:hypothetical protein
MRALSSEEIVKIWEMGQSRRIQDRAIVLLSFAYPGMTSDQLAGLTIGQRDSRLLELRETTFGETIRGFAECPKCGDRLEFEMTTADVRGKPNPEGLQKEQAFELPEEDVRISVRLPTSLDLSLVAACGNVEEARAVLVKKCVSRVIRKGETVGVDQLPVRVIEWVAARMAEWDPLAEVLLDLRCPACTHHWQVIFDITTFLWTEVTTQAKRLLREVHTLASAYGWREGDILSMSPVRRQFYLEKVTS